MKAATVAAVVSLALGMGACGGDDDDDGGGGGGAATQAETTAAEPLSKDEFLERANATCTEAQSAIDKVPSPSQGDFDQLEETLEASLEIAEKQQSELEALVPPAELKAKVDELNRLSRDNIAKIGEALEAAKARDAAKVQEVISGVDNARLNELSKEIGADKCAGQ